MRNAIALAAGLALGISIATAWYRHGDVESERRPVAITPTGDRTYVVDARAGLFFCAVNVCSEVGFNKSKGDASNE